MDIIYNLGRFGHREFGLNIEQGRNYCIEYVTTALLLQDDARRLEAVPVILAKNTFKRNLLVFLSQKYGTAGRLMGFLKILNDIKPTSKIDEITKILEALGVKEIHADERSILQKLRLYNVT